MRRVLTFTLLTVLLGSLLLTMGSGPAASIPQCGHAPDAKACAVTERAGDPDCRESDVGSTRYDVGVETELARVNLDRATACDNRTGEDWQASLAEAHAHAAGAHGSLLWYGERDDGGERSRIALTVTRGETGATATWRHVEDGTGRSCTVGVAAQEDETNLARAEEASCLFLGPPKPPGPTPSLLP